MAYSSSTGSPCGACKFLRRKCASNCVFAPYFSNENGAARFSAIHKVFGASNASKLLLNVPQSDRSEAVLTIAYEAQARLRDPVYGCVAHIFSLQHQVAILQAQLMQTKMQIAGMASSTSSVENQCQVENNEYMYMNSYMQNFSTDYCMGYNTELVQSKSDFYAGDWSRTMELMYVDDVTDFDSLASKTMRD